MAKGHTGGPRPNSNRQGRTRTLTAQKSPREKTRGSGEERTAGLTACCGDGANSRARARAARSLVCGKKGDHQRPLKPKFDEGTGRQAAKRPRHSWSDARVVSLRRRCGLDLAVHWQHMPRRE
jgi:hypothetical protein